jgi:class 3 adenylate cyclase
MNLFKKEHNHVYDLWIEKNFDRLETRAIRILLFSQLLMSFIDLAVLPDEKAFFFVSHRIGIAVTAFVAHMIISKTNLSTGFKKNLLGITFIIASAFFSSMLSFISSSQWFNDFSIAFGIFIACACYLLYNLQRQMVLFSLASCLFLAYASSQTDTLNMAAMNISTISILSLILFIYQGRLSRLVIEKTYESLSRVVPINIAKEAVANNLSIGEISELRPRESFGVALCSDWRDYQNLASKLSPKEIARLFEEYYETVFREAGQNSDSVAVFSDWVADELMVIFYPRGSDTSKAQVVKRALDFAWKLKNHVVETPHPGRPRILFDIGMAAGYGLIGLQGPSGHQKLLMIGSIPGFAKRLESAAKELRSASSTEPSIVMNEELYNSLDESQQACFSAHRTSVKNLQGQNVYCSSSGQSET